MIYTDLTKKAMRIAFDAHKNQVDKSGSPYIFHPFHLAGQMTDELSVCAALLHDVVEDTEISFADLARQGIPPAVMEVLSILTHDSAVPYADYIQNIKNSGNQTAITVKLADLRHNSDISRLDIVDAKTSLRLEKYIAAIGVLVDRAAGKRDIYIEKEVAAGWVFYVLRVGGVAICSSKNEAPLPRACPDPIQTDDLANKKTFTTNRDPDSKDINSFKDITNFPGLKLEYPVYDGDDPEPVAKMEKVYRKEFCAYSYEYIIYDKDFADGKFPFPRISISKEGSLETAFLDWLPENDVCVSIYPDESFVYDPRSLVEERYIVSIGEQHLKWLPHVFHAYILELKI